MEERQGIQALLAENLRRVQARVAAACRACGRDPAEIRLVWVSKYQPPEKLQAALALGARYFGENKAQEALAKFPLAGGVEPGKDYELHFIGHLQRNKVRKLLPMVSAIHSVDSRALLEQIETACGETGRRIDVFLQVNTSREPSKSGFAPEALAEVARYLPPQARARVVGLMTMGPTDMDPGKTRRCFRELSALREVLAPGVAPAATWLSMGMTHDLEIAIEEGAHFLRVGTGLFGARPGP